jgi:hypothetical protein
MSWHSNYLSAFLHTSRLHLERVSHQSIDSLAPVSHHETIAHTCPRDSAFRFHPPRPLARFPPPTLRCPAPRRRCRPPRTACNRSIPRRSPPLPIQPTATTHSSSSNSKAHTHTPNQRLPTRRVFPMGPCRIRGMRAVLAGTL